MLNFTMRTILIPIDGATVEAVMRVPVFADAMVIIATTSSLQNDLFQSTRLACELCEDGCASIVVNVQGDVLSATPLGTPELGPRNDQVQIDMVHAFSQRLIAVTTAAHRRHEVKGRPIGYFAQGLAAAAAVRSQSILGHLVSAVVVLDVPVDLIATELKSLTTPTLFLFSSNNDELYRQAKVVVTRPHSVQQMRNDPASESTNSMSPADDILHSTTAWFRMHFPRHTHWNSNIFEQEQV